MIKFFSTILFALFISLFLGSNFSFAQFTGNTGSASNTSGSGSVPNGTGQSIFQGNTQGFNSGTTYGGGNSNPVFNSNTNIVSGNTPNSVTQGQGQQVSGGVPSVNLSTSTYSCTELNWSSVSSIVSFALCITNKFLIPIFASIALLLFIWGVTQYVVNADNEEARENGRKVMIWGIVAISAMVLVYGLVQLLVVTLGLNSGFGIPQLK